MNGSTFNTEIAVLHDNERHDYALQPPLCPLHKIYQNDNYWLMFGRKAGKFRISLLIIDNGSDTL